MPIRFRCAYCNQLLGIARRKAGTVVRCPTCSGQVVVPTVDESKNKAVDADGLPVFERSDFEDLLNENVVVQDENTATAGAESAAPPAGAWGTHADPNVPLTGAAPLPGESGQAPEVVASGILLTPGKATMLTVLGIIALALAFGSGLLIGRFL